MDGYVIREVDSSDPKIVAAINNFNALAPDVFPPLQPRHFENGFWWLAYHGMLPVAFAGLVPMEPFQSVGYFKRCFVLPDYHGHGLQLRLMTVREVKARELGYTQIVSECSVDSHSIPNFRRAGFVQIEPEQAWGKPGSVYWAKSI